MTFHPVILVAATVVAFRVVAFAVVAVMVLTLVILLLFIFNVVPAELPEVRTCARVGVVETVAMLVWRCERLPSLNWRIHSCWFVEPDGWIKNSSTCMPGVTQLVISNGVTGRGRDRAYIAAVFAARMVLLFVPSYSNILTDEPFATV